MYSYTYDDAGNITKTVKNGTTYTYTYGNSNWGDLLTKYNGTAIGYDTIGNPTNYYNGWNFTWKQGREMATATKSGQSLSFTYNADGLRTTKTVNGVVHTYYYSGSKLVRETYGDYVLDFFYDQNGTPFMLLQNGNIYYYITNAQGDVIRLVDINGNVAASYRYDPYGKATSALGSHATINPLRYRGYVFDHETGLYYLQSRYYDPETGRFINEDNNFSNNNLFMYCANNPVNSVDTNGQHWYFLWLDDLINDFVEAINELLTCVSNIVYGQAAYERSFYDPEGAAELWNSRPYQNTTPSPEMQMFTALAYDSSTVYDISLTVSVPHTNVYVKAGVSRVLSPKKDIDATYVHVGGGLSTPSALPVAISYSVGGVQGVMEKENYAGHFFDKGASILFGFDYCFWPNGSSAYSFVVSNSYGVYYGYDYYWCID